MPCLSFQSQFQTSIFFLFYQTSTVKLPHPTPRIIQKKSYTSRTDRKAPMTYARKWQRENLSVKYVVHNAQTVNFFKLIQHKFNVQHTNTQYCAISLKHICGTTGHLCVHCTTFHTQHDNATETFKRYSWVTDQEQHSWYCDQATSWTTEKPWFNSWQGHEIFLLIKASRSALWAILVNEYWGKEPNHPPLSSAQVKNEWTYNSNIPYAFKMHRETISSLLYPT